MTLRGCALLFCAAWIACAPPAASQASAEAERWFDLGRERSKAGDGPGAIEAYRKALALDPRHAKAWHNLGNVQYRQGDLEGAAQSYAKALEIDPNYQLAAFNSGWMLRQLNRPTEAEQAFSRCLELPAQSDRERKTHLDCLYYRGTMRFRAEDYAAAATAMEQVLAANPGQAEARHYLGMAYRHLGREAEAREQLELHRRMLQALRDRAGSMEPGIEP